MVYDRTCSGHWGLPGLTASWRAGGWLYRALGRLDGWTGASSWPEALAWLASFEPGRPLGEIQYWGHGTWGRVLLNGRSLDIDALKPGHPLQPSLAAIRSRLSGPDALWWFRTCETFGTDAGHRFATEWTRYFGCRAAGHTFIIGPWQSGLHVLAPGDEPDWPVTEGVRELAEGRPRARWSGPFAPNTITFLHGRPPGIRRSE